MPSYITRRSLRDVNMDKVNMELAQKLQGELRGKNKSEEKSAGNEGSGSENENEEDKDKLEKEKAQTKHKFKQPPKESKSSLLWLVLLSLMVAVGASGLFYFKINNEEEVLYQSPRDLFLETMEDLKVKFPKIPPTTLFVINYTILSALDDNDPRSPATVLLLGTNGNKHNTDKVLHHLMEGLAKTFSVKIDKEQQFIDFEKVDQSNTDRLKMDISLKIDKAFEKSEHSFMAMKNVDKAPWDVVSTLHPYFDHENAPYKRVVYLCTATTKENMREEDLKEYRRLAENLFDLAWEKYHSDHRHAIYARLFTALAVF